MSATSKKLTTPFQSPFLPKNPNGNILFNFPAKFLQFQVFRANFKSSECCKRQNSPLRTEIFLYSHQQMPQSATDFPPFSCIAQNIINIIHYVCSFSRKNKKLFFHGYVRENFLRKCAKKRRKEKHTEQNNTHIIAKF